MNDLYTFICMGQDDKKNIYHINPVVSSHSPLLGNTFSIKPLIDLSKQSDDYMFKNKIKRFCFFSRTFYHCSIFTGRRFASLSKRNISPLLFLKNKVHLEMVQRFVQPFSFDVTIHSSLFLIVQLAYHHTLYAIYPF